jgi:hypothetical protein
LFHLHHLNTSFIEVRVDQVTNMTRHAYWTRRMCVPCNLLQQSSVQDLQFQSAHSKRLVPVD